MTVRAISSDRGKIVSGADDQSVIVWDKQTFKLLEELKGHDAPVSFINSSNLQIYASIPNPY
jgi:WD40 repeat protein